MASTGIRELKDNLSRYIRRIEAGERIAITAHGRVVAELVPPGARTGGSPSRFDELVASGVVRAPLESGDPVEGRPDIRLPKRTASQLIDADRGEGERWGSRLMPPAAASDTSAECQRLYGIRGRGPLLVTLQET